MARQPATVLDILRCCPYCTGGGSGGGRPQDYMPINLAGTLLMFGAFTLYQVGGGVTTNKATSSSLIVEAAKLMVAFPMRETTYMLNGRHGTLHSLARTSYGQRVSPWGRLRSIWMWGLGMQASVRA